MPRVSLIAFPSIRSQLPFLVHLCFCPPLFLCCDLLHFLRHLMLYESAHKLVLEGSYYQECWWLNITKYASKYS